MEIESDICYSLPKHGADVFNLNQDKELGVILRLLLKHSKKH